MTYHFSSDDQAIEAGKWLSEVFTKLATILNEVAWILLRRKVGEMWNAMNILLVMLEFGCMRLQKVWVHLYATSMHLRGVNLEG